MLFSPWLCSTMFGASAGPANAWAGTSAADVYQHPAQMGESGSPPSNSIQTPDPTTGTTYCPIWTPANGRHGIANPDGVSPSTSGTSA